MRKPYTKDSFCQCIPWEQIERYLTKKEYNKFMKWMCCQTVPIGGVYEWDLERWLNHLPCID